MNDIPRNKFEILDLIFTLLFSVCLVSTAIFLLYNLVVSIAYVIIIVLFTLVVIVIWISRNPFNVYLVRTFAFSNFIVSFVSFVIMFASFTPTSIDNPGFVILLFPSGIYILLSFRFSAVTTPSDKKEAAMLGLAGLPKASQRRLYRDNPEERIKREELIAKLRKRHKFKLIIGLCLALILSSLLALIFGFT